MKFFQNKWLMCAIKRHVKRAMQNLYIMFFSKWKCEPRGHCIGLWCFTQVKWYQRMKMTIHTIWLLLFNLYFSEGICGSMCSIIINSDRFLFSFFLGSDWPITLKNLMWSRWDHIWWLYVHINPYSYQSSNFKIYW